MEYFISSSSEGGGASRTFYFIKLWKNKETGRSSTCWISALAAILSNKFKSHLAECRQKDRSFDRLHLLVSSQLLKGHNSVFGVFHTEYTKRILGCIFMFHFVSLIILQSSFSVWFTIFRKNLDLKLRNRTGKQSVACWKLNL